MAQVGIAGSVRVEDGAMLLGQVGVAGHHTIGKGARLAAQAGVFGDIPAGETWSGYPARPHREALRAQAALFKLPGACSRRIERLLGPTRQTQNEASHHRASGVARGNRVAPRRRVSADVPSRARAARASSFGARDLAGRAGRFRRSPSTRC